MISVLSLSVYLLFTPAAQEPANDAGKPTTAQNAESPDKVSKENTETPPKEADRPVLPIDAELLKSLEKQVAEPAVDENPLARVGERMRDVQGRLVKTDPGEETRQMQKAIVEDLDKLIAAMKKGGGCPQCGSSKCEQHGKSPRNTSNKDQQQQQASQPKQGNEPNEGQVTAKPGQLSDQQIRSNEPMVRAIWGHLPDKLREEMQQSFKESDLPKYREMIERYFRTIAEQNESRR